MISWQILINIWNTEWDHVVYWVLVIGGKEIDTFCLYSKTVGSIAVSVIVLVLIEFDKEADINTFWLTNWNELKRILKEFEDAYFWLLKAVMPDWHWKDAVKNSANHKIEDRNLLALWETKTSNF